MFLRSWCLTPGLHLHAAFPHPVFQKLDIPRFQVDGTALCEPENPKRDGILTLQAVLPTGLRRLSVRGAVMF